MESLWKKESNCADAVLIDLFSGRYNSSGFKEWDRRRESSDWKHCFLLKKYKPEKNNKVSDELRTEGNMYYKMRSWLEAMELYSQSLCFAEPGTDNISFAYANRASCFMQMKLYDMCLKDIEMATNANYPEHLMPKLMKRKDDCVKLMKDHTPPKTFDPKLSFKANKNFLCMADVLEIQQNAEFGRHVVAKCDLDVGQTVLVEENFVTMSSNRDRVNCFECMQTVKNFIPCSNCTDAMFCGEYCAKQSKIHEKCCGLNILRMPSNIKYVAHSILIAINQFSDVNELIAFVEDILSKRSLYLPAAANDPKSKYALFLSLQPSPMKELYIETVYKIFSALLDVSFVKVMFESKQSQRFLIHLIGEHFLIISNNSYGGSLAVESTIHTTALVLSLFNHACAPNVFNSSGDNKEVVITMRPIKKGERVFVKYLCGNRTTKQRQEILLNQYGFLCKCDRCVPHCKAADRSKMKSDSNFRALAPLLHYGMTDSNITDKCVNFLRKYGHLPWSEEIDCVLKLYTQCLLDDFPSM